MNIQNSYQDNEKGTLYVVPTPIGNLDDMTFRAVSVLEKVDCIAAEDTRHTQKLLNHFSIKNHVISYHEHNKKERGVELVARLENGEEIAVVSDAGMPAISDPGYDLVKFAIEHEINVVVLPGANAALCALVGSGLSTEAFLFYGFLPRKLKEKESELERLSSLHATLLFYESPFRVKDTLEQMAKQFGNRQIVIAREITKIYEQYVRGNVEEVIDWAKKNEIKGECCIVVEGNTSGETEEVTWWDDLSIEAHVEHYEKEEEMSHKEAMKQAAVDRNISRREVYKQLHVDK